MSDSSGRSLTAVGLHGGAAVVLGQVARTLTQLAGMLILARLLDPSDFGLVAMATAVTGVTAVFSDFGLSMSVMRSRQIDRRLRDSLWYINACLSAAIAAALLAAAPLVADFYHEPRLQAVTGWLALAAFLNGLVPQFRAELARTAKFHELGRADAISQGVGVALGILAALAGAGYWAVVVQQITSATALLTILACLSRYLPTSRPTMKGLSSHLRIGSSTLSVQATNYLAVSAAPIALGRLTGADAVGLYSRAYQLVALPLVQLAAPLTRVVVPLFARVEGPIGIVTAAKSVHRLVTYALLSTLAFIFVGGAPLVVTLFGSDWAAAGRAVEILALGGMFQAVGYINYWLFVQRGRLGLLWILETLGWASVFPLYFFIGPSGQDGAAVVYALGLLVNWLLTTLAGLPRIQIRTADFLVPSLLRLLWLAPVLAAGVCAREAAIAAGWNSGVVVLSAAAASVSVTALEALLIRSLRSDLRHIIGLLRQLVTDRDRAR